MSAKIIRAIAEAGRLSEEIVRQRNYSKARRAARPVTALIDPAAQCGGIQIG
jgi:hypothetical protein